MLDSAGYGPVTISQSVSIIAPPGVYAGVTVTTGIGIAISGTGINVALKGLTVVSQGGSTATGVSIALLDVSSTALLQNISVSGFHGLSTAISGVVRGGTLTILDSVLRDNHAGDGMYISGQGYARSTLVLARTLVESSFNGLYVDGFESTLIEDCTFAKNATGINANSGLNITIARSSLVNNYDGVIVGNGTAHLSIADSTISGSIDAALIADGAGHAAEITASRNVINGNTIGIVSIGPMGLVILNSNEITNNGTGVSTQGGGAVWTRGTNTVAGNTVDTVGEPYVNVVGK